jgi:hypothetical protein
MDLLTSASLLGMNLYIQYSPASSFQIVMIMNRFVYSSRDRKDVEILSQSLKDAVVEARKGQSRH